MNLPAHPKSSIKELFLRLIYEATGQKAVVDRFFTHFLKHRQHLRSVEAKSCIPEFEESEVRFRRCPLGVWSTPIIDVYVLIKAAIGFKSKRILELGSYRGDTARLLAENTPDDVRICTVDIHPDHGSSYLNTPVARRIDRKVGKITPELFSPREKFDFIFVDADHDYKSVMADTSVALNLLSSQGVIFWHDYHFQGYFNGMCGIPEALKYYATQRPIIAVSDTTLAMSSNHPGWETSSLLQRISRGKGDGDVWQDTKVRG